MFEHACKDWLGQSHVHQDVMSGACQCQTAGIRPEALFVMNPLGGGVQQNIFFGKQCSNYDTASCLEELSHPHCRSFYRILPKKWFCKSFSYPCQNLRNLLGKFGTLKIESLSQSAAKNLCLAQISLRARTVFHVMQDEGKAFRLGHFFPRVALVRVE